MKSIFLVFYLFGFFILPACTGDRQVAREFQAVQKSPEIPKIDDELLLFKHNTKQYMSSHRPKWDESGAAVPLTESLFQAENLKDNHFVELKNLFGGQQPPSIDHFTAPIGPGDDPKAFVDDYAYENLEQMDQRGLAEGRIKNTPWSDSYWPFAKGVISNRHADPGFPDSLNWKTNAEYIRDNLGRGGVERFSAAEKYDLLMGDSEFSLTRKMLREGQRYYDQYGTVESWMGICHGWAPASYAVDRPRRSVTMLAADGQTQITFSPSDIKALISLLWANGTYSFRQMGTRCNIKNPQRDSNGRVIEPVCFDDNPGAWHLAIVNQVGHSQRSFVMDATYDYQVWNQPLIRYQYSYFNPESLRAVDTLEGAKTLVSTFGGDKFERYRGPQAVWLVGVVMEVTYGYESVPSTRAEDMPEYDRTRTVRYLYDLELSGEGTIIGGEWYTNLHPDFLWGPTATAKVSTFGDRLLDQQFPSVTWAGDGPVPSEWKDASLQSVGRSQPLARVVEVLNLKAQ